MRLKFLWFLMGHFHQRVSTDFNNIHRSIPIGKLIAISLCNRVNNH
nr:MAG TPA: hypothetical protein [Caudoviricetes sp.]